MEAPPLERRLVAIMAADVEGYSRLMGQDEEIALTTLSTRRTVVDDLIGAFGGRIANTAGDSVLAEFGSVVDSVRCALVIQKRMEEANVASGSDHAMTFRIGINVGDVMVKGSDIFGDGVNIAARLQTLAPAGGTCVSRGVRDHIRHLGAFVFEDLGEQLVKNIDRPVRAFIVTAEDTAGFTPTGEKGEAFPGLAPAETSVTTTLVDLAMWETVRGSDKVEDLLRYLERFPEGEFAALARDRIADLSRSTGTAKLVDADTAVELAFWDTVTDSDTLAMYTAYLDTYPAGKFAPLATVKLTELGT